MSEKEASEKKRPKFQLSEIIILVLGLLVLIGIVVVWAVMPSKDGVKSELVEKSADLSSLHTFPPIDFVDSLYYKKVIVSYDEEGEMPRDVFYYEKDSTGQPTNVKVHETHYYPGNKKYIDGNVSENARDGLWYAYHQNGNVQTMAHYRNGKEDGVYAVYYENGNVRYTGEYKAGRRVGVWSFYDENEKLVKTENFDEK